MTGASLPPDAELEIEVELSLLPPHPAMIAPAAIATASMFVIRALKISPFLSPETDFAILYLIIWLLDRRHWLGAAVPLLSAALLGAGCGGSDSGGPYTYTGEASIDVTTSSLTPRQFALHAGKICRHGWGVVRTNLTNYRNEQPPRMNEQKLFAIATQLYLLPGMDFEIFDNLRRLGAPKGEKTRVEETIGTMQEAIERTESLDIPSPTDLAAQFEDFNAIARRDGLTDCIVTATHASPYPRS